jgi:hypothetical protein
MTPPARTSSAPPLGNASAEEPTAKPRPASLVVPTAASTTSPVQPIQKTTEIPSKADDSKEMGTFEEIAESTEYGFDLEL